MWGSRVYSFGWCDSVQRSCTLHFAEVWGSPGLFSFWWEMWQSVRCIQYILAVNTDSLAGKSSWLCCCLWNYHRTILQMTLSLLNLFFITDLSAILVPRHGIRLSLKYNIYCCQFISFPHVTGSCNLLSFSCTNWCVMVVSSNFVGSLDRLDSQVMKELVLWQRQSLASMWLYICSVFLVCCQCSRTNWWRNGNAHGTLTPLQYISTPYPLVISWLSYYTSDYSVRLLYCS